MIDGVCLVDQCPDAPHARGWCRRHYNRWRRHGDPLAVLREPRDYAAEDSSGEKRCTGCDTVKPLAAFPVRKDRGGRARSHCTACGTEMSRTPASRAAARQSRYVRKYGITVEDFEAMLTAQGSRCAICTVELTPETWHIDHDHATGQVRKVLCAMCNKGLGLFVDDPDRLIAAAEYLRKHREDASCPSS